MPALQTLRTRVFTPIGLDIGQCGVRTAQLLRRGDTWILHCTSAQRCSPTDVPGDKGKDSSGSLTACIAQTAFHGRNAVVGINPPDVEFLSLELPEALQHSTMVENAIHMEIERLMTCDPGTAETRFYSLPSGGRHRTNAIGVAARREAVETLLRRCDISGLRCQVVDAMGTALARFGHLIAPRSPQELWGLLDLAYTQTRIILCIGHCPILVRTVPGGGHGWTGHIAQALAVSEATAEFQKCAQGLGDVRTGRPVTTNAADGSADGQPNSPESMGIHAQIGALLLAALKSDLQKLAVEIKRSFEYALSCYPGSKATTLILTGGGGLLKHLPEFLESALEIQVRPASYFMKEANNALRVETAPVQPMEVMAGAVGLALYRTQP